MTATWKMVVRNNREGNSRIYAICLCESRGTGVLGYDTGEIELRNERDGTLIGDALRGHKDAVYRVDISGDGRTVVSRSDDGMGFFVESKRLRK